MSNVVMHQTFVIKDIHDADYLQIRESACFPGVEFRHIPDGSPSVQIDLTMDEIPHIITALQAFLQQHLQEHTDAST